MFDPINFALMGDTNVTVVDLDAWGITPVALTLMGQGGGSQEVDIDHQKFWSEIKPAKIVSMEIVVPGNTSKTKLLATGLKHAQNFGGNGSVEAFAIMNGLLCQIGISAGYLTETPEVVISTIITVSMYPLTPLT